MGTDNKKSHNKKTDIKKTDVANGHEKYFGEISRGRLPHRLTVTWAAKKTWLPQFLSSVERCGQLQVTIQTGNLVHRLNQSYCDPFQSQGTIFRF